MLFSTHLAGGAAAGAALALVIPDAPALGLVAAAAVAALGPDIDHAGSLATKILGPAGRVTAALTTHRGVTHSPVAAAALGLLLLVLGAPTPYVMATVAGYLSHLVLDSLNPQGVPWLWPLLRRKITLPLVRTGGTIENLGVRPGCYLLTATLIFTNFYN
ncbi:MAG: metal-dependent hydrolase [Bacillota bacterium]